MIKYKNSQSGRSREIHCVITRWMKSNLTGLNLKHYYSFTKQRTNRQGAQVHANSNGNGITKRPRVSHNLTSHRNISQRCINSMGFERTEHQVLLHPQSWPFMPRIKYAFKIIFGSTITPLMWMILLRIKRNQARPVQRFDSLELDSSSRHRA